MRPTRDQAEQADDRRIQVSVDGVQTAGLSGQTVAGVLLSSGRASWRTTRTSRRPRGVFCGIGICFDCVVTVNGERDVRACQRRAEDGDVIITQSD